MQLPGLEKMKEDLQMRRKENMDKCGGKVTHFVSMN